MGRADEVVFGGASIMARRRGGRTTRPPRTRSGRCT